MVLRRDQVLARIKDSSQIVDVPELGGEVRVIKPPATVAAEFYQALAPYADEKGQIDTEKAQTALAKACRPLLEYCVRDADNEKMFEGPNGDRLFAELKESLGKLLNAIPLSSKKNATEKKKRKRPQKKKVSSKSSRPSKRSDSTSPSAAGTPTQTT